MCSPFPWQLELFTSHLTGIVSMTGWFGFSGLTVVLLLLLLRLEALGQWSLLRSVVAFLIFFPPTGKQGWPGAIYGPTELNPLNQFA